MDHRSTNQTPEHQAISEAARIVGGTKALALALSNAEKKVSPSSVNNWLHRDGRCSPLYVLKVEKVTGVSRHRLRPDLYPEELPA